MIVYSYGDGPVEPYGLSANQFLGIRPPPPSLGTRAPGISPKLGEKIATATLIKPTEFTKDGGRASGSPGQHRDPGAASQERRRDVRRDPDVRLEGRGQQEKCPHNRSGRPQANYFVRGRCTIT